MLRSLALLANLAALAALAFLFLDKGPPGKDETLLVSLLISAQVLSITALLSSGAKGRGTLPGLWLERLRLEQEARIATLQSQGDRH